MNVDIDGYLDKIGPLSKGDILSPTTLERIFGDKRTTPGYRVKLLLIMHRIQEDSYKQGTSLLCRTEKEHLVIMTDADSVGYKSDHHRQAVRKTYRVFSHMQRIDPNNLTSTQAQRLEKEMLNQSRVVQALLAERRRRIL